MEAFELLVAALTDTEAVGPPTNIGLGSREEASMDKDRDALDMVAGRSGIFMGIRVILLDGLPGTGFSRRIGVVTSPVLGSSHWREN